MEIDILSLFPEYFQGPLGVSILKRAQEKGLLTVRQVNIRDFAEGKHRRVDERPYGGGPGMVLMVGPVVRAIRSVKRDDSLVIYLSAQGKRLDAPLCQRLATEPHLVLLSGHYEGVDERAIEQEVDEEISIGPYVLTSGCAAALVLIDATARFIPGVLGNEEAALCDSFQGGEEELEGPQYTRPEEFEGYRVPPVLLGGNHSQIEAWRRTQAIRKRD